MELDEQFLAKLNALRLRKAKALLFFLLVNAGQPHRTEKLSDLMWQTAEREQAGASCRQAVHTIRLALADIPSARLQSGSGLLALSISPGFRLMDSLLAGLSASDWRKERSDCLRGYFAIMDSLAGISASFDSWLTITQSALLSATRKVLDPLLSDRAAPSPVAAAIAEFALQIEPSNEIAARFLMKQHWHAGRPTRSIEVYNALYGYLGDQFDQEPEPETVALLAAIKLEPQRSPELPIRTQKPQVRMGLSLYPETHGTAEAMALSSVLYADLRMRLGRFREWRVVGTEDDEAPQITLNLHPSLSSAEPRLIVEMLEGRAGALIWSERVDNPWLDWESKIRLVLFNVATALSVVVADRAVSDPAAGVYDRWLRAQVLLDTWSPRNEGAAVSLLRDITQEAPRFGPAHAELAGALNVRHVLLPGTQQTDEIKQLALHHAIEAVSIDPLDTRAHRVLAWCYCHKGEFGLAEFHFDQALALNPANPLTLASAALGFAFTGAKDQSAELVGRARRLGRAMDPFHLIYLAAADYLCGDYEAAASQCQAGAGLMTTVGGWHSAALWKLGRREEGSQRLCEWFDVIGAQWRGQGAPTGDAILDWFAAIFPLRDEHARADLRASLADVAQSSGRLG